MPVAHSSNDALRLIHHTVRLLSDRIPQCESFSKPSKTLCWYHQESLSPEESIVASWWSRLCVNTDLKRETLCWKPGPKNMGTAHGGAFRALDNFGARLLCSSGAVLVGWRNFMLSLGSLDFRFLKHVFQGMNERIDSNRLNLVCIINLNKIRRLWKNWSSHYLRRYYEYQVEFKIVVNSF